MGCTWSSNGSNNNIVYTGHWTDKFECDHFTTGEEHGCKILKLML
jgi:hypothetical protein